jgi:hypothetical protein
MHAERFKDNIKINLRVNTAWRGYRNGLQAEGSRKYIE